MAVSVARFTSDACLKMVVSIGKPRSTICPNGSLSWET